MLFAVLVYATLKMYFRALNSENSYRVLTWLTIEAVSIACRALH